MTDRQRQPIFNAPAVVVVLVVLFIAVHLVRESLRPADDNWVIWAMAFIPARYGELGSQIPGAPWAAVTSFVTHTLLHGDFMHLGVNSAWLLAVGTPIARRMSWPMFVAFAALCGIGGAVFFLATNPGGQIPVVGASGAISGLMAAVFRLMFAAGDVYGRQLLRERPEDAPRLSLKGTLASRPALTAIGVWVVINALFALGVPGLSDLGGIAWQAHLGGFFTGLVAFDLFDRGHAVDRPA